MELKGVPRGLARRSSGGRGIHYMELKAILGAILGANMGVGGIHYMELKVYFLSFVSLAAYNRNPLHGVERVATLGGEVEGR